MGLRELILDTCRLFNRLGVEYALIGGYAGILHGSPYMTTDLDFVVEDEGLDSNMLRELKEIGWEPTEEYENIEEFKAFGQFIHKDAGVVLHIFPEVLGFRIEKGIKVEEMVFSGELLNVCSVEDYLIMRACVWDERDKMMAVAVSRAQERLDDEYLEGRAREEGVTERIKWILDKRRQ